MPTELIVNISNKKIECFIKVEMNKTGFKILGFVRWIGAIRF
jgi:hypothetical protein